ncbi:MAG: hypothetical protein JO065_10290 [Acidobacteria bacterium]|nr:hypothetical protein [Acidobacteriota bacterium]
MAKIVDPVGRPIFPFCIVLLAERACEFTDGFTLLLPGQFFPRSFANKGTPIPLTDERIDFVGQFLGHDYVNTAIVH